MAVMARTLLLQMDKQLLIISVSSGVGLMAYLFLYYRKLEADDKATLLIWIKPLSTCVQYWLYVLPLLFN